MTVINLSEVGKSKLRDLAAKGVLSGLMVEELDNIEGPRGIMYNYFVSSRSNKIGVHNVLVYKEDGKWFATCDEGIPDEDACRANRVGLVCCGHIAVALAELKKKKEEAARIGPGFTGKLRMVALKSLVPYVEDEVLWERDARTRRATENMRMYDEVTQVGSEVALDNLKSLSLSLPNKDIEIVSTEKGPNQFYEMMQEEAALKKDTEDIFGKEGGSDGI